jgi:general secretion pathway protein M
MNGLPEGRRGQALAVGILLVLLAVFWTGIVSPLLDWHAARGAEIERQTRLAEREARLVEELPSLRQRAAQASGAPVRATLPGSTDAIAGAALQEQVQSMATQASAQLASIETLNAEQVGAYRRIGVRVALNAKLPVIVHLLDAVERATPAMLVDDLRLTSTPIAPRGVTLPLEAAFTVYAFRQGTAREATQ